MGKDALLGQCLSLLFATFVTIQAKVHVITVGKAANKFDPDSTQADVGDILEFQFYPSNHSVVRSSFGYPCIPYSMVVPNVETFFSGFRPVQTVQLDPPTYNVRVNDTAPIFFYCSAPDACNIWGMVGVVNPRNDTPLSVQRSEALNSSTIVLQPGEPWPSEADGTTKLPSNAPSGTTVPASVVSLINPNTPRSSAGLSSGGIAGVVIGSAAVIALICGLFFVLGRRRPRDSDVPATSENPQQSLPFSPPNATMPPPPMSPLADQYYNHAAIRASYGSTLPGHDRFSHDYVYAPPAVVTHPEEHYKHPPPPPHMPVEIDSDANNQRTVNNPVAILNTDST